MNPNEQNFEKLISGAIDTNNLACEQRKAGNFAEAEKNFRMALDYDIKARGGNHPKIAHRMNNLSVVLIRTGNFSEAKDNLDQAWKIMNFKSDITGFRILFIRMCLALLNDKPFDTYLGQIKTILNSEELKNKAEAGEPWGIDDFIFYISNKLPEDKALLLQTIFNVHNKKQNLYELNELSLWREQYPESLETEWNS